MKIISFIAVCLVSRDPDGNAYNRHINLQLTYSFQNNTHNSMHLNNNNNNSITNNNNSSKSSLYAAHNFGMKINVKFIKL